MPRPTVFSVDGYMRDLFGDQAKPPADQRICQAIKLMEKIIEVDGIDAGVIYKSTESPTEYNEDLGMHVYKHQYFCELGDALIELYYTLRGEPQPHQR